MKNKIFIILSILVLLSGCVGVSSKGLFGTGVSVAFDPRSVGTQIDDSIMQKNLSARILLLDKKYRDYDQVTRPKPIPLQELAKRTNHGNLKTAVSQGEAV